MDDRMLKSKICGSIQEVILPDFLDDDGDTVTTTVTKSRRVSFGTNFVKEFMVGSAVSAQCVNEYEQAFSSSDSSTANSSHSAVESGILSQNTYVMDDNHKSTLEPEESQIKRPKISSTICFSADSPTADMEFTEGCISLAKSILDKKNKEMTVIIQAKPKESKEEIKIMKDDETKYFEGSQFDMSMTKCFKSKENKKEEKRFESDKTRIFNKFDDEMSITRCDKIFRIRQSNIPSDDDMSEEEDNCKENIMPLDLIMRHLDKDNSDLEKSLFNPEKLLSDVLNKNPLDISNDSEKLNLNESMDITRDIQNVIFKIPRPVSSQTKLDEDVAVDKTLEEDMSLDSKNDEDMFVEGKNDERMFLSMKNSIEMSLTMRNSKIVSSVTRYEEDMMLDTKYEDVIFESSPSVDVINKEAEPTKENEGINSNSSAGLPDTDPADERYEDAECRDAETDEVSNSNEKPINLEFAEKNKEIEAAGSKVDENLAIEARIEDSAPVHLQSSQIEKVALPPVQTSEIEEPVNLPPSEIEEAVPVNLQSSGIDMIASVNSQVLDSEEVEPVNLPSSEMEEAVPVNLQSSGIDMIAPVNSEVLDSEEVEPVNLEVSEIEDGEIVNSSSEVVPAALKNIQEMSVDVRNEEAEYVNEKIAEDSSTFIKNIEAVDSKHDEDVSEEISHDEAMSIETNDKEVSVNKDLSLNSINKEGSFCIENDGMSGEIKNYEDMSVDSKADEAGSIDTENLCTVTNHINVSVNSSKDAENESMIIQSNEENVKRLNCSADEFDGRTLAEEASLSKIDISISDIMQGDDTLEESMMSEPPVAKNDVVKEKPPLEKDLDEVGQPSLVDSKVIQNLKDQASETGCIWALKDFRYPSHQNLGVLLFDFEMLESTVTVEFSLKSSADDRLDSCSSVPKTEIRLNEDKGFKLPEYKLVKEFGFVNLKKIFEKERKSVKLIRHVPYFLDQMNLFAVKINACLRQVYNILTSYPGSTLNGSILSFRLFSFPIFFSCNVSIDLTDLHRLSTSCLSFEHDFGSLDKTTITNIFQECLKCENCLCEFVIRSTKYLIDVERKTGYVSKRQHIRLLPSDFHS